MKAKIYPYSSAFADSICGFITFKASVGISGNSRNWHLYDFDRWCVANNATTFDQETVEGWVLWRKAKVSSDYVSWMSYIRELGRWLRANGHSEAYVLSDDFKSKIVRPIPYLLTADEIATFFDSAAHYKVQSPLTWEAKCLFGLMHSCGLRTCEARRLKMDDVDVENKHIDIMWSKGHRSRRLAVTDEIISMLQRCNAETTAVFGEDRSAFFVTSTRRPVSPAALGVAFRAIWENTGLSKSKAGKAPNPYAFRHHFAYANIERWGREGVDVMAMLPYLARYMGHATFDSTYYYVHTSPDFMNGFASDIASTESLLPEVGFDE